MLFLISPAKTLDYDSPIAPATERAATEPAFMDRAAALIALLKPQTPAQIASLMDLSDDLAALNVGRYAAWQPHNTAANSRPAALAFNGDVYEGLQAATLTRAQLAWAQEHLVILSGLYGAMRPLDRLQPYRLEMGTRLANPAGRDLYAYWGDTVADYLNARVAADKPPVIVNLASQEYARVALRPALRARVVECVFEEAKGAGWKVVSFYAKRARGLMARWAIQNKIASPKRLEAFAEEGYAFDAGASTRDRLVYRRRTAP